MMFRLYLRFCLVNRYQGAKSGGEMESAQAKNEALKEAGAVVPTSYEAFEGAIKETFEKLVGILEIQYT